MTDNYGKCLEIICNFPAIYKSGDKSPLTILGESGYGELFDQVTEDKISEYINNKVHLIETWLTFTEDIRHSPVWVLQKLQEFNWRVVFFDRNAEVKSEFIFDKGNEACAKMIKMTMEEIRKSL